MNIPQKPFYFIRHGETDWNKAGKVMGQKDIILNENGIAQAHVAAEKFKSLLIDVVIASPLKRAYLTAEIIAKKINKPIIVEENLQECCWGIMEGKLKGDCSYNGIPFNPEEWWQLKILPEQAESFIQYSQRVMKAISDHLLKDNNILFVAHGGTAMVLLSAIGQPSWHIDNAVPYYFKLSDNQQNFWDIKII